MSAGGRTRSRGSRAREREAEVLPACPPDARHCITCSDEGLPMRVVGEGPDEGLAVCEDDAGRRVDVLTELVGGVEPGDRLLVHAGTALLRLSSPPGGGPGEAR